MSGRGSGQSAHRPTIGPSSIAFGTRRPYIPAVSCSAARVAAFVALPRPARTYPFVGPAPAGGQPPEWVCEVNPAMVAGPYDADRN